jgi:hypothetical protein
MAEAENQTAIANNSAKDSSSNVRDFLLPNNVTPPHDDIFLGVHVRGATDAQIRARATAKTPNAAHYPIDVRNWKVLTRPGDREESLPQPTRTAMVPVCVVKLDAREEQQ